MNETLRTLKTACSEAEILDGHLVKDGDLAHTAWWEPTTTADGRQVLMCIAVFDWQPSDDVTRFEYWDRCEHPVVLNAEGVHELWRDADPQPRHPLAPLVRAWWKRPVEAPSYRLALSLAFWWHDPGKMRTPTQRGGKGRGKLWRQTRQVERYPVVTDAELIAMTYPSEANNVGSTRRSRLQRSREALAFLVETGYANVATDRCILPGQNWAGWG